MDCGEPPECAWTELGGCGPRLIFTHANGFPPDAYRTLLEMLRPHFRVSTFANRPMWSREDPRRLQSWHPMADELGAMIGQRADEPVVALGHSLGGMLCALAAARNPGLFAGLVLLDPVVFSGAHALAWGWTKRLGLARRFPLVRGARRRRDSWPDREAVRSSWSGKPVFADWDPRTFEDFLAASVADDPSGPVTLRYPKAWEARIFEVCPHNEWPSLRRIERPVLVVRGEASDTLRSSAAKRMEREMPDARVVELEGTSHFLPMEKPEEIARLIIRFVGSRFQ